MLCPPRALTLRPALYLHVGVRRARIGAAQTAQAVHTSMHRSELEFYKL